MGDPIYSTPAPILEEQFYEIMGYYPDEEEEDQ